MSAADLPSPVTVGSTPPQEAETALASPSSDVLLGTTPTTIELDNVIWGTLGSYDAVTKEWTLPAGYYHLYMELEVAHSALNYKN